MTEPKSLIASFKTAFAERIKAKLSTCAKEEEGKILSYTESSQSQTNPSSSKCRPTPIPKTPCKVNILLDIVAA